MLLSTVCRVALNGNNLGITFPMRMAEILGLELKCEYQLTFDPATGIIVAIPNWDYQPLPDGADLESVRRSRTLDHYRKLRNVKHGDTASAREVEAAFHKENLAYRVPAGLAPRVTTPRRRKA